MTLYVDPYKNWIEYADGFEMQQINLTWSVTSFKGIYLDIQVNFNNASYLSPQIVQDTLMIVINPNKTSIFQ